MSKTAGLCTVLVEDDVAGIWLLLVAPPAGGTKEGCFVGGSTNEATFAIRTSAVQGPSCGLGSRTETGGGCGSVGNATTPIGSTAAAAPDGVWLTVVAGFEPVAPVPALLLAIPVVPFPSELVTLDGAVAAPAPIVIVKFV